MKATMQENPGGENARSPNPLELMMVEACYSSWQLNLH